MVEESGSKVRYTVSDVNEIHSLLIVLTSLAPLVSFPDIHHTMEVCLAYSVYASCQA